MKSAFLTLFIALMAFGDGPASAPSASTPIAPKRPKIGVALAGGAALGLAHVGVLQWFEENRIPIDYIAGTSMGGLVSGIHAVGYNSTEMIQFVQKIDWQGALAGAPPYRDKSFRRKEDAAQYPMGIEIGLKGGRPGLPSGLSPGEGVALVIESFSAGYSNMKSFNDLPTPFRCVSSNLATGKGVVFDKGSLFDALRATMSLPAIFAPVRMDGMVLVDGALTNNLPVNVVKEMGADVTIAVALDVPVDPNQFKSLLGVAGQSISYMVAMNERPSMAAADIVVMPLLKGLTGSDYTQWEEFRKIGYAAAEAKAAMLKKFQLSESEYQEYQKERQSKRRPQQIAPQQIIVEGDVAPRLKEAVIASLTTPPGTVLSRDTLDKQMLKLTGVGRFDTATYEFLKDSEGKETLLVRVHEKSYGPPFLNPVINLSGANGEGLRWGIGARLTFLDIGGPGSEWRTDLNLGTNNWARTEYFYRIKGSKWFLSPSGGLSQDTFPVYNANSVHISDYKETLYGGTGDFGYAFGRAQELRAGYDYGYLKTTLETGVEAPRKLSGPVASTHVLWRYDTRDNPLVPTSGISATGRAAWFNQYPGVARDFPLYQGNLMYARHLAPKYSLLTRVSGGTTVNEVSLYSMFKQGGLFDLSSLSRQQSLGNNYYFGSAYLLRSLSGEGVSMFGRFYGLVGYEAGNAWFPGQSVTPRQDGLFGIVGSTQLGLIFFGGSFGDSGTAKIQFRVGRVF